MKDFLIKLFFAILFALFIAAMLYHCTSPEVWYAEEHDSYCETLLGHEECGCYQRLVKEAK